MAPAKHADLGTMHVTTWRMFEALVSMYVLSRSSPRTPLPDIASQVALTPVNQYLKIYSTHDAYAEPLDLEDIKHLEACLAVGKFPIFFARSLKGGITYGVSLSEYMELVVTLDAQYQPLLTFLRDSHIKGIASKEGGKKKECGPLEALEYVCDTLAHLDKYLSKIAKARSGRRCFRWTPDLPEEIHHAFMVHRETGIPMSWLGAKCELVGDLFTIKSGKRKNGDELIRTPLFREMSRFVPIFGGILTAHVRGDFGGGMAALLHQVKQASANLTQCMDPTSPVAIFTPQILQKLMGPRSKYAQRMSILPGGSSASATFKGKIETLAKGDTLKFLINRMPHPPQSILHASTKIPTEIVIEKPLVGRMNGSTSNDGEYCVRINGKQYYMKICIGVTREAVSDSIEVYTRLYSWADQEDRVRLPMLRDALQWRAVPGCICVFYIFDWIDGETLLSAKIKARRGPSEPVYRTWLADVLRGLYILHMNGIRHNAITPNNILITNGGRRAILVDLELAMVDSWSSANGDLDTRTLAHIQARKRMRQSEDAVFTHESWCLSLAARDLLMSSSGSPQDAADVPDECSMSRSSASSSEEESMAPPPLPPCFRKTKLLHPYEEAKQVYKIFEIPQPEAGTFDGILPRWARSNRLDILPRCVCYCASDANWAGLHSIVECPSLQILNLEPEVLVDDASAPIAEFPTALWIDSISPETIGVPTPEETAPINYYRVSHANGGEPEPETITPGFEEFMLLEFEPRVTCSSTKGEGEGGGGEDFPHFADTMMAMEAASDFAWVM